MSSAVWSECILPYLTLRDETRLAHSIGAGGAAAAAAAAPVPVSVPGSVSSSPGSQHPSDIDLVSMRHLLKPSSRVIRRLHILLTQSHRMLESHFQTRIDFNGETHDQFQSNKDDDSAALTTHHTNSDSSSGRVVSSIDPKVLQVASIDRDVWRVKDVNSQPFALNFLRLWRRYMTFNHSLQDENHDPEFDWQWLFDPVAMTQLRSGLLIHQQALNAIQKAEAVLHSYSTSDPVAMDAAAAAAAAALQLLQQLLAGLSRLMSVHTALTSIDAYFCYNNFLGLMDQPSRVGGFHLTPFTVQWPTSIIDLYHLAKIVRKTNLVFVQHPYENRGFTGAIEDIPICQKAGGLNGAPTPCSLEEVSAAHSIGDGSDQRDGYVCSSLASCACDCIKGAVSPSWCLSCGPIPIPGGLSSNICMCHMQILRGCAWWHCTRGSNLIRTLLLHQLGLSTRSARNPKGVSAWPGTRGSGWSRFFGISTNINSETGEQLPPILPHETLTSLPNQLRYGLLPEWVFPLLDRSLPWSLDVCTDTDPTYSPIPMLVAAPIADGWVGGFIGSCTWPPEN